jgi:hypothetical protein
MKKMNKYLKYWLYKNVLYIKKYKKYFKDFYKFKKFQDGRFLFNFKNRYPCLFDLEENTPFDTHYVYHTAWAARIIAQNKPELHIDVGSSLYFISLVSAFLPIHFYDYRPPILSLSNLQCKPGNILSLPFSNNSIFSLSCMHVLEHIGLGRYGDPLNPTGDNIGAKELIRVLAIVSYWWFSLIRSNYFLKP